MVSLSTNGKQDIYKAYIFHMLNVRFSSSKSCILLISVQPQSVLNLNYCLLQLNSKLDTITSKMETLDSKVETLDSKIEALTSRVETSMVVLCV